MIQQELPRSETNDQNLVTEMSNLANTLSEALDPKNQDQALPPDAPLIERAMETVKKAKRKIAEQAACIAHLERIIMIDPLTNLLNRKGFEQELTRVLAASRRYNETGMLIFVDLDESEPNKNRSSNEVRDEILKEVALLLERNVREGDYVSRLGNNEFAILLIRISEKDGIARAESLSRRLNNSYFTWMSEVIGIRANCSIKVIDGSENTEMILERTDNTEHGIERIQTVTDTSRSFV